MRVKRYVVDSMPDALQQIRSDLGSDAVILNTKEIRSGGFLGLFSKKKIEVIAAVDSASSAPTNAARTRQATSPEPSQLALLASLTTKGGVAVMEEPATALETVRPTASDPSPGILAEQLIAARQSESYSSQPLPVVSPQQGAALYGMSAPSAPSSGPPAKQVHAAPSEPVQTAVEDTVLSELRAVKQMMQKLSAGALLTESLNPVLEKLKARLTEQEMLPSLVEQLLNETEAQAVAAGEEIDMEYAERSIRDQLRLILGANSNKALQSDTRIAHFVGPTGVGKTTTIAKLAAEQVLKYRRKVGFITSDTYRIAAVEQLKTYSTILGVPLEVVFSPQDLKKAFEALQDCDIIFMDTAGRNFRNEMYVSELNALLHSGGKSETFLVLSLTMKYKDMRAIADNFSRFKLEKVLFTKRDETDTFGSVVNLLHEFPLGLSYITNGQNVPDDFTIANENELIDLILEEHSNE